MKLKIASPSLLRATLAIVAVLAISVTGLFAIPAQASAPPNGEYSCSTGTTTGPSPTYTITNTGPDVEVTAGSDCLAAVVIPTGVTSIGNNAFLSSALTSIDIPSSVTYIGSRAFSESALTSIVIPSSITSIENGTFGNARDLASVTIPNSVTSIAGEAFGGTSSLRSITIPASVTSIGGEAFTNAINLSSIYFLGNAPTIQVGGDTFGNLPVSARALIQPSATGFDLVEDLWNGLFVSFVRDVGRLDVDCDLGDLDRETVVYLEVGDFFSIYNDSSGYLDADNNFVAGGSCLIEDLENILEYEEADHSNLGTGLIDWDSDSEPIKINNSGTFTISEAGGDGATVTFRVTTGILFGNPIGGNGWGYEGDVFEYEEVFILGGTTVVDATVTISKIDNLNNDEFMLDGGYRDARGGLGSYLDPISRSVDGSAKFTIAFHAEGDPSAPITLSGISLTVKDIDNEQYVAAENVDSYRLSATPPTELRARTVGTTLYVEELDGDGSSTEDEDHWVVLNFDSASTITLTLGSRDGNATFNTLFAAGEWSSPPAIVDTNAAPPTPPPPSVEATKNPTLAATTEPASAAPVARLAKTGANYEWLLVAGLIAVIAGSSFVAVSRRKRVWYRTQGNWTLSTRAQPLL
jgi:LPXTG-motif cell wall-anchored protein